MAAAAPWLPPLKVVCAMFQLPRGCPKPCTIEEAFGPLQDAEAAARLSNLQQARGRLEKLLGSDLDKPIIPRSETAVAPASEVVACMEQYWRCLAQLTLSIEADPESVQVTNSFAIEWPSQLTRVAVKVKLNSQANSEQICGALYLETSMLLASRAMMLANHAIDVLGPACTGDPRAAATSLRTAAGILDSLAAKIENEGSHAMNGLVQPEQRPYETLPAVCVALRDIFLSQAQQCAVAQAITSGTAASNPALMAKLSLGVVKLLNTGVLHLRAHAHGSAEVITGIASKSEEGCTLSVFWAFSASLWTSLADSFTSKVQWDKENYGLAVAYQQRAVALSGPLPRQQQASNFDKKNRNTGKGVGGGGGAAAAALGGSGAGSSNWRTVARGLPCPMEGRLRDFSVDVEAWRVTEGNRLRDYELENGSVYFFAVPKGDADIEAEAGGAVEPVVMMKIQPLEVPDVVPISLARKPRDPDAGGGDGDGDGDGDEEERQDDDEDKDEGEGEVVVRVCKYEYK